MAITEAYSGTSTIGTTEWDLASNTSFVTDADTTDGVFQVMLDLSALATADEFVFRLYEKVTSGGTQRLVDSWAFLGPQGTPHRVIPALILLHGWAFTLQKVAGTDRSITWSIRSVA